jgi:hypothetical protein
MLDERFRQFTLNGHTADNLAMKRESKTRQQIAAEQGKDVGDLAQGLTSIPVATVKGAAQGFLGLPGDIEMLTRGLINMANDEQGKGKLEKFIEGMANETIFPTTEKIKEFVNQNVDYFQGEYYKDNPYETLGEFVAPGGYIKAAKQIKKAAPIVGGAMATTTKDSK